MRTGSENFQSSSGTVIRTFKAKEISFLARADNGHLQVYGIDNLVITGSFDGSRRSARAGLIEAHFIERMDIHHMTVDAQILLS